MFTPRYSSNTAKVGVKHQSYMFTSGYSSNTAKIGVKHQSINHLKKLLSFMKPVKLLPANYVS